MPVLLTLLLLSAPDVGVELKVKKPLRLDKHGELKGTLEVQLTNRGTEAVTLQHRDVHGFRFQPSSGDGGTQVIFHSCDCGFELSLEPPPASRTLTLQAGEKKVVVFDDFTCGGGPFRPPPPGRYAVSWSVGPAPASPVKRSADKLDLQRCDLTLRSRPPEAFESPSVAVELKR